MNWPHVLIALSFVFSSISQAATYYVSPDGSDSAAGSLAAPFKTIQKAMNVVNPGDVVMLRGGTYRETVSASRGGNAANPVTVQAYPGEVPVIKGSDVVTDWTLHNGSTWKKAMGINVQQVFVDFNDTPGLQQIGMPSGMFNAFKYPNPVGTDLSSIKPGSFYYDKNGKMLYVWLADGSDPNKHLMEVSVRMRLFFMNGDYIHMKGIKFRHANGATYAEQAAAVELSSYSVADGLDIQYTDFTGLGMGYLRTGARAINSIVSNNGDSGITGPGSYNFVIANNKIFGNNTRNFNPLWHAGGIKATTKAYGVIENNEVAFNNGSGIWCDYCNGGQPIIIRNNYIHNNGPKDSAIFLEVTNNASVYNNVIANNTRRGIYVAASNNSRIYNNTIVGTKGQAAIDVHGMPRGKETLKDNEVRNNLIIGSTSNYDISMIPADGVNIVNNTSDYNNIYRDGGAVIMWSGVSYNSLDTWKQKTNQDVHSMSVDPKFAGGEGVRAYGLGPGSGVIDKGVRLEQVAKDYLDNARPQGGLYDMGALEQSGKQQRQR